MRHPSKCTASAAGEDIRWLPRTRAADLILPGADCFVFDHRVVRWNFQNGDGTNPRREARREHAGDEPRPRVDAVAQAASGDDDQGGAVVRHQGLLVG